MAITDTSGKPIGREKSWDDMGVHTKLSILRMGIGEVIKMNLVIMNKLGIEQEEEKDGREETGPGVDTKGTEGTERPTSDEGGRGGTDGADKGTDGDDKGNVDAS